MPNVTLRENPVTCLCSMTVRRLCRSWQGARLLCVIEHPYPAVRDDTVSQKSPIGYARGLPVIEHMRAKVLDDRCRGTARVP